jgi:hypothetical protein
MKPYVKTIVEYSLFKNSEFDERFDYINDKYPGVHEFLMTAKEWGHEVDSNNDPQLYSMLKKLKRKKSIMDLSEKDLRNLYTFLVKRGVSTYDDMEEMFIGASGE